MSQPPTEFRTRSLILRRPVVSDAQAIFEEYAADPVATRYLTWTPHRSVETVAEFLSGLLSRAESAEEFSWVLAVHGSDRAIGMLGARSEGSRVDIGYVVGRRHWGKGYMTEAVSGLAERMLALPEIYRIGAVCDVENVASARILDKSGFDREGVLRRWLVLPNRSSEPRDCFVYGRVR